MVPVYGSSRRTGPSGPWSILRPGPRSALSPELLWAPLSPLDNTELAALIARAEAVDDPPYRTRPKARMTPSPSRPATPE